MTVTYHVPAFDAAEAREIGYAVHAGRMGHIEHYLDPAAAQRVCDHLNRLGSKRREVFTVEVESRTTHDGVIPVASIGEIAAALFIVIGGAYAVGLGSIL